MDYTDYSYLYPPRPDTKIPQGMLGFYQKRGYVAQVKKNGTCTVIFANADQVIYKTRHGDVDNGEHKMWSPKPEHTAFFKSVAKKGWSVFVAELLHSKTPHIKHDLFVFDQLVHESEQLVGTKLSERLSLLEETLGTGTFEKDKHRVHEHVARAHSFKDGFNEIFTHLAPEDEGVVLKNPKALLSMCSKETSNNDWQVKSRIPHKNYGFVFAIFAINIAFTMALTWQQVSSIGGMI